jgi:hypothetical protein
MSVNKLAEYMSASATKRRTLIIDQIVSPKAKILNYGYARTAFRRVLANPQRNPPRWFAAANVLRDRAAISTEQYEADCLRLSAHALEAFAPYSERLKLKGVICLANRRRNESIILGEVQISTRPEVSLIEPGTEHRVGAVQFHASKSSPLSIEGLQYVATLLYEFLLQQGDDPIRKFCIATDAFSGGVEIAPRAFKTRLKALQHACEEIAERWPSLYEQQLAKYIH